MGIFDRFKRKRKYRKKNLRRSKHRRIKLDDGLISIDEFL